MWHEARKQERMIRGLIVDYRRRAERRKDFYEKIKAEPTQFLQLHGRPCKIHLDPAVAAAGDSPAIMMPWQGDTSNLIDRFDVRAHLDIIQDVKHPEIPPEDLSQEERLCNYERYRILAQNVFLGISEDKFLQQLAIEEQFGVTIEEKEAQKEKLNDKKGGVAIGYNYNDLSDQPSCSIGLETKAKVEEKDSDDDSDLEIIDVDLSIDVNKMEASQAHELNAVGPHFGMTGCDLFSFLTGDADDAEHQKQVLREEKEKAMFSGRKSRRERRAHRDKKLATRVISPPSYAAPSAELPKEENKTRSLSRSPSPDVGEKIQFITSFGGDDEEKQAPPPKPLYADKLKVNLKRDLLYSEVARKTRARSLSSSSESGACRPRMGPHRPKSRSFSPSRSLSRGRTISSSRSSSRSRSRSRPKYRSRSRSKYRSKSRSYSPQYRRSKSRSRSRLRNSRLRRSRSNENKTSDFSKRLDSKTVANESQGQSKPTVPRYYGRKKEDKSSSELSLDSDSSATNDDEQKKNAVGTKSNTSQNQLRLAGSSSKGSRGTMSLKDKLKKKMQAQLSRQLRADKRAEAERMDRESRRQARRDEEMRELAIKLRRKQREMRHQQYRRSSEDSDGSRSGSSSRDSVERDPKRDSRSRSDSPREKTIPVIDTRKENPPLPDRPMPPYSEASYYQNCPPRPPPEGKYYGRGSEQRNYQNRAPADELRGYNNRGTGSERGFRGPGDEHRGFPSRGPGDERSYQSRGHDNERSYQNRGHDSERSFLNRPSGIHQRDFQPKYVERPREDSKGSHDNDKREFPDYDTRWRHEGNDRRPVGHRGSFRGQSRFEGQGWQRHDDEPSGSDKSKVKLVDY